MGVLVLDKIAEIVLDDELLEHVFAVVVAKLRRHEPVVLSWNDATDQAQQAFVNPTTTVHAEYDRVERGGLDRHWLERLMVAANSTSGIDLAAASRDRDTDSIPTAGRKIAHLRNRGKQPAQPVADSAVSG